MFAVCPSESRFVWQWVQRWRRWVWYLGGVRPWHGEKIILFNAVCITIVVSSGFVSLVAANKPNEVNYQQRVYSATHSIRSWLYNYCLFFRMKSLARGRHDGDWSTAHGVQYFTAMRRSLSFAPSSIICYIYNQWNSIPNSFCCFHLFVFVWEWTITSIKCS